MTMPMTTTTPISRVRPEMYFSVDLETDGTVVGDCSISSIGACIAGTHDGTTFRRINPSVSTFYAELAPLADRRWDPEAAAIGAEALGLSATAWRERLQTTGLVPAAAIAQFQGWVRAHTHDLYAPVLVSWPATFDWAFLYDYFHHVGEPDQRWLFHFGATRCVRQMYAVKAGVTLAQAKKPLLPAHLRSRRAHTHHALDDALEQADLFANIMEWPGHECPRSLAQRLRQTYYRFRRGHA